MTASAYVFCSELQTALPAATHTTSIDFPLVQDTRPITADWPALADTNGSWVYFDAQIQWVAFPLIAHCLFIWQSSCPLMPFAAL